MRIRDLFWIGAGAFAGTLAYGALVESKRLTVERRELNLPNWPKRLNGYRIAVLADLHLNAEYSIELGQRAVESALDASPDMVVLPGDLVSYWREGTESALLRVLEPLLAMNGNVIATPGNREYWQGSPEQLVPVLDALNIRLLRNELWVKDGIQWVGADSLNGGQADPILAMQSVETKKPCIALWHEPDAIEALPPGADLMISGHTHGGQFRLPNGWAPVHSKNGKRFQDGFFPEASTPLYVSRGIGTTGPPSRLFCPPEVSVLTLNSG